MFQAETNMCKALKKKTVWPTLQIKRKVEFSGTRDYLKIKPDRKRGIRDLITPLKDLEFDSESQKEV